MAKTIDRDEAQTRLPDARLVFDEGNYNHALRCYYVARDWVVTSGQAFRHDIYGIIEHPHHSRCPRGQYHVPQDLIDVEGWSVTVNIWCADDAALEWLGAQPAPEGSRLIKAESKEWPEEL
jgi:hypothetical protein